MPKSTGKSPSGGGKGKKAQVALVPVERVERSILLIRGEKVLLDADLAGLFTRTLSSGEGVSSAEPT